MNMKHIFVYMAPVFFAYILKNYCFCSPLPTGPTSQPAQKEKRQGEEDSEDKMREEEEDRDRPRFSLFRFVQVALVVIAVGGLSVGPFVILGQVQPPSAPAQPQKPLNATSTPPIRSGRFSLDSFRSAEASATPTGLPTSGPSITSLIKSWLEVTPLNVPRRPPLTCSPTVLRHTPQCWASTEQGRG